MGTRRGHPRRADEGPDGARQRHRLRRPWKMFCGAGDNVLLLTKYVRDEGKITIEEAINLLTWRAANFFNLHDRGRILEGKRADVVVFNLDEIDRRPEVKV